SRSTIMASLHCLVLSSALTLAQQPAPAVNTDDPLPTHALARFGTSRWRMPDEIRSIAWSADGKVLVASSYQSLVVFDAISGKPLHEVIPPPNKNQGVFHIVFALSGNSKVLAVASQHI